jgi:hypothetical protein
MMAALPGNCRREDGKPVGEGLEGGTDMVRRKCPIILNVPTNP